jgi:hypothetical protein
MQPDWPIANTTDDAQRSEIGILFDWLVTGSVVATNPARASGAHHQHAYSLNATMPTAIRKPSADLAAPRRGS